MGPMKRLRARRSTSGPREKATPRRKAMRPRRRTCPVRGLLPLLASPPSTRWTTSRNRPNCQRKSSRRTRGARSPCAAPPTTSRPTCSLCNATPRAPASTRALSPSLARRGTVRPPRASPVAPPTASPPPAPAPSRHSRASCTTTTACSGRSCYPFRARQSTSTWTGIAP